MQPDLRCYYHPDREATSQCDRCGDYLCCECTFEWKEQHLCKQCLGEVKPKEPFERIRDFVVVALIYAVVALMMIAVARALERLT